MFLLGGSGGCPHRRQLPEEGAEEESFRIFAPRQHGGAQVAATVQPHADRSAPDGRFEQHPEGYASAGRHGGGAAEPQQPADDGGLGAGVRPGHGPLRGLGLRRRRALQVQRTRVQVLAGAPGPAELRVPTQHRGQGVRALQTLLLRPALGEGHGQGCQRV